MHRRPPSRDRNRRRRPHDPLVRGTRTRTTEPDRKREADAKRQREKRQRDSKDIVPFPGRAPPAFIEAMKARAVFFGATKQEAERDANDPKKIAALAFAALDYFAAHWYEQK